MDFFNRYKRYFILGGCFILLGVFVYLYMANNDDKRGIENLKEVISYSKEYIKSNNLTNNYL